jgi:hypothetical protein
MDPMYTNQSTVTIVINAVNTVAVHTHTQGTRTLGQASTKLINTYRV